MAFTFSQTFMEKCLSPFLSLSVFRLLDSEKVSKSISVLLPALETRDSMWVEEGEEKVGVEAWLEEEEANTDLFGVSTSPDRAGWDLTAWNWLLPPLLLLATTAAAVLGEPILMVLAC